MKKKEEERDKTTIKPLYDRIMVKRIEAAEQVKSGIIIPDTAKEKPMEATIVAIGDGKVTDEGKRIPLTVRVKDRVLVGKYSGTDINMDDEEYLILRESEVLAIVEH